MGSTLVSASTSLLLTLVATVQGCQERNPVCPTLLFETGGRINMPREAWRLFRKPRMVISHVISVRLALRARESSEDCRHVSLHDNPKFFPHEPLDSPPGGGGKAYGSKV